MPVLRSKKPDGSYYKISVKTTVDPDLADALERICRAEERTVSETVRLLIKQYVKANKGKIA